MQIVSIKFNISDNFSVGICLRKLIRIYALQMFTFSMRRTWNVLDFSWLSVELLASLQA